MREKAKIKKALKPLDKEEATRRRDEGKQPAPVPQSADAYRALRAGMGGPAELVALQRTVGNRAVQRMVVQRPGGDERFKLDDETGGRITRARGGGQPLEGTLQKQMGASLGHDFSGVRVHTGPEADELNQELRARAFTTGPDIFFKRGAYDPGSSVGRELIAHELSHVVQQSSGRVSGGGSGMTVRPAGDAFEQEADALVRQAVTVRADRHDSPGRHQEATMHASQRLVVQRATQCPHCRATIAEDTEKCPRCGMPTRRQRARAIDYGKPLSFRAPQGAVVPVPMKGGFSLEPPEVKEEEFRRREFLGRKPPHIKPPPRPPRAASPPAPRPGVRFGGVEMREFKKEGAPKDVASAQGTSIDVGAMEMKKLAERYSGRAAPMLSEKQRVRIMERARKEKIKRARKIKGGAFAGLPLPKPKAAELKYEGLAAPMMAPPGTEYEEEEKT